MSKIKTYEELSSERKALQKALLVPEWFTTAAYQMFNNKYSVPGEKGVRGRFETIAKTLSQYLNDSKEWEAKFFNILWRGWLVPSSPVYANVGTDRGLPISCSGGVVGDSIDSFYMSLHEQAILSKHGFGCSGYFGDIRPRGSLFGSNGNASGAVPVIEDFATMAAKVSQGNNRRGSTASYLPIDHGDFDELCDLLLAKPDGLNIGWNVSDNFISKLKAGDEDANRRFTKALYTKLVVGKGYFFFVDKANRHRPQMYKDKGLDIKASNLCSEISLHSSERHSFSCVLSSMNLHKWDEWKDTDAVFTAHVFLDAVISYFLDKAKGINGLQKVVEFTKLGRATGMGVMGFSSYLQKKRIPFESLAAQFFNNEVFKHMREQTYAASRWLAEEYGEPEWCKGYGMRNTHTMSLPPTKSSSILAGGVSESVFPEPAMIYEQASAAGGMFRISAEFYHLMKERGTYNNDTIESVINARGSVQHLDWLSEHEKLVFRTAFEVEQEVIRRYASQRQKYIDQGQSLNFFVSQDGDEKRISQLLTDCFLDEDILSVYYFYSRSGVIISSSCSACEA